MARQGQNPMRWVQKLEDPAPLTLATIVAIPELSGFWEQSLVTLRACLDSVLAHTPQPFDLMVLDNGSCAEVRSYLQDLADEGAIDLLLLSRRNLGKVGAWNALFALSPGQWTSYFDSDVYFLPGWWEASKQILEAYPEALTVTAQPIPGDLSRHCDATLAGAREHPGTQSQEGDDLIPPPLVESHRQGLGEEPETYAKRLRARREVLLRRPGAAANEGKSSEVEAYVSSSHFQFSSPTEALRAFFPLPTSIPLGDDPAFDTAVDAAGAWRLSTVGYHVHHLGNRTPELATELPWAPAQALRWGGEGAEPSNRGAIGPQGREQRRGRGQGLRRRLAHSPRVRRWLKAAHRQIYSLLYES
ncbi:MAG: glycosyltransferase family A protein [Acidobacteriota bacterium]